MSQEPEGLCTTAGTQSTHQLHSGQGALKPWLDHSRTQNTGNKANQSGTEGKESTLFCLFWSWDLHTEVW